MNLTSFTSQLVVGTVFFLANVIGLGYEATHGSCSLYTDFGSSGMGLLIAGTVSLALLCWYFLRYIARIKPGKSGIIFILTLLSILLVVMYVIVGGLFMGIGC